MGKTNIFKGDKPTHAVEVRRNIEKKKKKKNIVGGGMGRRAADAGGRVMTCRSLLSNSPVSQEYKVEKNIKERRKRTNNTVK